MNDSMENHNRSKPLYTGCKHCHRPFDRTAAFFIYFFVLPQPAVYCRMSINGNLCPVFPTELGFICGGEVWRRVWEECEWNHNFKCPSQYFF